MIMRIFLLLFICIFSARTYAGGLTADRLSLTPSTLPTICTTGDLRTDANASYVLKLCVSNVWSVVGSPVWGSITGTLSAQTDLQSALNLKAPLASPTFTGTVTAPTFAGALTGNASTATALASNPTDCSSNQYANAIDAGGNLTCAQVAYSQVTGTPTAPVAATAGTLGLVNSTTTVSHQFLTGLTSGTGAFTQAQPAFSDLSGSATGAQLPNPSSSTLGGIQSIAAVSHNFLTSISTGGVPAQAQPACGDLSNAVASCSTDATNATNISSGTLPAGRLPNPSASTLGGVQSAATVSNQWINSISTSGVPALSQPAFSNLSGTATATQGGTAQSTWTTGDVLYASASNTLSKLAIGSTNAVLTVVSGIPAWVIPAAGTVNPIAPFIQNFTSGSSTYFLTRVFTLSGAVSLTSGWTYSHNAGTCTVEAATTSSTTVLMSCTTVPTASGTLTCVSCGATGNQTFNSYVSPLWLEVEVVGGGAGGSGGAATPAAGNAGNASSFGTSLVSANGGNASAGSTAGGAPQNTCTINAPAYGKCQGGGGGGAGFVGASNQPGGIGGGSCLGGNGNGGTPQSGAGTAAATNSGSGGGGGAGGAGTSNGGPGGGAGACARVIIPASLTNAGYAYVVGGTAAGTAGSASGGTGGGGAAGNVKVTEHFNY